MTISADPIPPGFTEMGPLGPFDAFVGPMFELIRDGRGVIGLRVGERHRNLGPAKNLGYRRWRLQSPCPRVKEVFAPLFSKSGLFLTFNSGSTGSRRARSARRR